MSNKKLSEKTDRLLLLLLLIEASANHLNDQIPWNQTYCLHLPHPHHHKSVPLLFLTFKIIREFVHCKS